MNDKPATPKPACPYCARVRGHKPDCLAANSVEYTPSHKVQGPKFVRHTKEQP